MMTDPDYPATPHSCHPEIDAPVAKALANRFMMEVRTEIRQNRKRPRESFDNAVLSVEERFSEQSSEVQEAVRELQITKDLRPFLQLQDNTDSRRMLILFADKDLDALQNAQYVLGDGNFKYNSKEFHNPGQLYTLHAVVNGESQPIVYMLMQALDIIGALATTTPCIFDNEAAVIIATKNVFSTTSGTPKGPRTTNMVEGWHNGLHSRLSAYHPALAELIQFIQVSQFASQNRIQALLRDPLAVASAPSRQVRERNEKLREEMALFSSYVSATAPTFQDIINYLDRVAAFGLLVQ
ncbi:hypothetical protein HPB47_024151 [Ixodes persulcatus]|uniref:Uncharacterized protein n=1 Tax=Ixodes persulcatus TaxID=34615 RepID=A0AC60Q800_IXOPE|nr:hypothetical protein HPB47_024151 [Ixodes persulcatus]